MTTPEGRPAPLEDLLPAPLLALADWRWKEAGWPRDCLDELAQAATGLDLATIGGQVQLRLPDALAELYWRDYDPTPRRDGEVWTAFVARSWKELLFLINDLPADALLGEDARRLDGLDDYAADELTGAVRFVVYLAAEPSS